MKCHIFKTGISFCMFLFYIIFTYINISAQDNYISSGNLNNITFHTSLKQEYINRYSDPINRDNDIIHFSGMLFEFESDKQGDGKNISFHPNPMTEFTRMYFTIPESGRTVISIYDLTGKKILDAEYFLEQGQHACILEGINKGMYIVTVRSGRFIITARLLSATTENSDPKLTYINMGQDKAL